MKGGNGIQYVNDTVSGVVVGSVSSIDDNVLEMIRICVVKKNHFVN